MREIKFRGISLNTGEWVYGGYYNMDGHRHIIISENTGSGLQRLHEPIDILTLVNTQV